MQILHIGDIVGSPGRRAFILGVQQLREESGIDFVVANAENAAGGRGLTPEIAESLLAAGADVLTLGDHAWDQKEILPFIESEPRVIRPANFPPGCPGRGFLTTDTPFGRVTVMQFIGRVFMPSQADCPFRTADALLARPETLGRIILAEMHCEATSEKIAFGRHLDGRVSAMVGTHTHVQTSDEALLPEGAAYITDLGMTGPKDSVLGRNVSSVVARFITGMPQRFGVASDDVCMEGVLLDVDEASGRAKSIRRIRQSIPNG